MKKAKDRLKRLGARIERSLSPRPSRSASVHDPVKTAARKASLSSSSSESATSQAGAIAVPRSTPNEATDTPYEAFKSTLKGILESTDAYSPLKSAAGALNGLIVVLQILKRCEEDTLIESKVSILVSLLSNSKSEVASDGAVRRIEELSESILSDARKLQTYRPFENNCSNPVDLEDATIFATRIKISENLDMLMVEIALSVETDPVKPRFNQNSVQNELGLRLLALDGGRDDVIGSYSQLLVLRELMRRLSHDLGRKYLKPCEWFDMMGGSGTGGLVAIMLGRLEMTVDDAINAYTRLFPEVFSNQKLKLSSEERTKQLEEDLKTMIRSNSSTGKSKEKLMTKESEHKCKVFVCAIDLNNTAFPVLCRSYPVRSNATFNCSLTEAARATTAIHGRYRPVAIGEPVKQSYISASHGHNNPTEQLLREAQNMFPERSLSCVVSLGTGHPGITKIESSESTLAHAALQMASDCERIFQDVSHRLAIIPSLFFRLSVDQGMQSQLPVSASENTASEVQSHTMLYLAKAETSKIINELVVSLDACHPRACFSDVNRIIPIRTYDTASKQYTINLLDKLEPVEQAIYNAISPVPRRACTENTRKEVLQKFISWALDKEDRKIYYLNGMAGTGKTTLAYTLCQILQKMGLLGGTFFCSRADHNCSDANQIASTLASQLSRFCPAFCDNLIQVLDENAGRPGENIDIRFSNVIVKPLKDVSELITNPIIVVIDALDECKSDSHVLKLMHNLWSHASNLPVKFFVTSRPEPPFHNKIYTENEISTKYHLHSVEDSLVERDIRLFLEERLRALANDYWSNHLPVSFNWPPETQLNALAKQSGKLFIYAATACQYIGRSKLNLSQRLEWVVNIGRKASRAQTDPLDSLYTGVLEDAYQECEGDERRILSEIIGSVITAISPLSVNALGELLRLDPQIVMTGLSHFHSVLNVPSDGSPVTTLHASFPDYLSNQSRSQQFYLDSAHGHLILASLSLRLMEEKLREKMCNQEGFPANNSIPEAILGQCISPALAYACNHWPSHVYTSGKHETINVSLRHLITKFFETRSLMWIECLSYIKALYPSIQLLRNLERWVSKTDCNLATQILDVRRYVSQNIELLSINALESYNSALLWLPETSFIRRKLGSDRNLPNVVVGLAQHWDPCEMILTGHSGYVTLVAFSPDGARIASGSDDRTVRIWNATTGEPEQELTGHSGSVTSAAFSPDGARIASGSFDHTVRIWNATTGESERELTGHSEFVRSVAFSPDGARIASGSNDRTVRIWNATTGESERELSDHSNAIRSVAFSPDGARIASGSDDRTVRIWNATTGESERESTGHSASVWSVAFSPDGAQIASGSLDNTVRIWNATTGESERELTGHSDSVWSVAFSPDGALIASGSLDRTVRIWNATTGESEREFTANLDWVMSVAFSPDGSRVFAKDYNGVVVVWDATNGELQQDSRKTELSFPSDHDQTVSFLRLNEDRRWLIDSSSSRKYWIPPEYANFLNSEDSVCFHSNKVAWGYSTGRLVIITV